MGWSIGGRQLALASFQGGFASDLVVQMRELLAVKPHSQRAQGVAETGAILRGKGELTLLH